METWDAVRTLRAVRRFEGGPMPPEHLDRIVDAGRRAPSSMNLQRWAFVVCTDRPTLERLSRLGPYTGHLAEASAAVGLVTPDREDADERESIAFDLGQCVQNMLLAAWDLGLGGAHASPVDPYVGRDVLGYPDGWRCDYLLSFGHPASRPAREGRRRPAAELRHDERW